MNTPNKLTVARIILTPLFFAVALIDAIPYHFIIADIVFAVAAYTDHLDGKIARKNNIVTNFGKFLDPLADKMLTTAAFIIFLAKGIGFGMPAVLFIVLFREFLVSSLRLVTVSSGGKVVAANIWGKLKTVTQMVAILAGFVVAEIREIDAVASNSALSLGLCIGISVLIWLSTLLCIISGGIYLYECRDVIDPGK